jgi:hypothetical protein
MEVLIGKSSINAINGGFSSKPCLITGAIIGIQPTVQPPPQ